MDPSWKERTLPAAPVFLLYESHAPNVKRQKQV